MHPVLLILILLGAIWLLLNAMRVATGTQGPNRAQRQAFEECDQLVPKGYLAESCSNVDDMQWQFGQALARARISQDAFQLSEALHGLARARIKKGDGKSAVPLLEEALTHEPNWYKPRQIYSDGIRRELEEAKAIAAKQTE